MLGNHELGRFGFAAFGMHLYCRMLPSLIQYVLLSPPFVDTQFWQLFAWDSQCVRMQRSASFSSVFQPPRQTWRAIFRRGNSDWTVVGVAVHCCSAYLLESTSLCRWHCSSRCRETTNNMLHWDTTTRQVSFNK